jgi:hypothetical protein
MGTTNRLLDISQIFNKWTDVIQCRSDSELKVQIFATCIPQTPTLFKSLTRDRRETLSEFPEKSGSGEWRNIRK